MSAFGNKITKLSQIQKQGAAAALPGERIEEIDPDLIDCEKQIRGKDNPGFTVESLTELGNDMKRDGQHEPAVLRKNPKKADRYLMVAGERRWRGCKIVGLKLKAVVRDLTAEQARRVQRAENIQRENLTQLEIAVALREDKERLGTLEKVAAEWNKGINWVAERIKFLEVVEADGRASHAVASGVTADITAVNDLHRLEKADPAAAKAVIEQAKADPSTNVRKAVRDKLQDVKPTGKEKIGKAGSRMREPEPAAPEVDPRQQGMFDGEKPTKPARAQLAPEAAELVAFAAGQAETLCAEVSALSKMLQQRPDVVRALGDALQSIVHAQTELFRTRHALAALTKPE
jgi:ParB family transcriptional regulator, chromosome partitioning protein